MSGFGGAPFGAPFVVCVYLLTKKYGAHKWGTKWGTTKFTQRGTTKFTQWGTNGAPMGKSGAPMGHQWGTNGAPLGKSGAPMGHNMGHHMGHQRGTNGPPRDAHETPQVEILMLLHWARSACFGLLLHAVLEECSMSTWGAPRGGCALFAAPPVAKHFEQFSLCPPNGPPAFTPPV